MTFIIIRIEWVKKRSQTNSDNEETKITKTFRRSLATISKAKSFLIMLIITDLPVTIEVNRKKE